MLRYPAPAAPLHELRAIERFLGPARPPEACGQRLEQLRQLQRQSAPPERAWRQARALTVACLWNGGEEAAAEQLLHDAVQRDGAYSDWRVDLASLYRLQGRFDEAIDALQSALRLEESTDTLRFLAMVRRQKAAGIAAAGGSAEALTLAADLDLLRAAELDASIATEVFADLAKAMMDRSDFGFAAHLSERAISAGISRGAPDEQLARLYRQAASAHAASGQSATARAYRHHAAQLAPAAAQDAPARRSGTSSAGSE